jgi:DNA-binding beta-propeller fold protein YncE
MKKSSKAFPRILAALLLVAPFPRLAWALVHTTVADFKTGSGDGGVQITNTGDGEVTLIKAAGALGSFGSAGTLPLPLYGMGIFASADAVYLVAGRSSATMENGTYSAVFNGAGTLGPWTTLGNLPDVRQNPAVAVWENTVYCGGGTDSGGTTTLIYKATMSPGGGLSAWSTAGNLPIADGGGTLVAAYGYLVYEATTGGPNDYSAAIHADGSLGPWNAVAARPQNWNYPGLGAAGNAIFSFGGNDNAGTVVGTESYSTLVHSDGTLSAWGTLGNILQSETYLLEMVSNGAGKLYSVGGSPAIGNYASTGVYSAVMASNGTLGTWSTEQSLPAQLSTGGPLVADNGLWYFGGTDQTLATTNNIYYAALNQGTANAAFGTYENVFNLGSMQNLSSLSWVCNQPGQVSVEVRQAGADGVYGAWSAASSSSPIALTNMAQYVEYRLSFQDSGSGSVQVSQVQVNATAPAITCGSYLAQWPTGSNPEEMAVDSAGNLYVVEGNSMAINIYSPAGLLSGSFGSAGSGNGQFTNPNGIVVTPARIYVADTVNQRIQYFSPAGVYQGQWGSAGTGNGQFDDPFDLAIASSGNVYVTDTLNNRIQYFNATGSYLGQWGVSGTGNGQFNEPIGIAVGPNGKVYVMDKGNNRVQVFSASGAYLFQWGSNGAGDGQFWEPLSGPAFMKIDCSGNVYVADSGNNRVEIFDPNGNYLSQWGSAGTGNGQFTLEIGLAIDNAGGFVYVNDWGGGANRIEKFGCASAVCVPTATPSPTASNVPSPTLSPSFSVSPTSSPSPTPSPSFSRSPTVSPTFSVSPTASPSPSPSPLESATPAPSALLLHLNPPSPNPSSGGGTWISYWISTPAFVSVKVYTVSGELVKELSPRADQTGEHERLWDDKNEAGTAVASGIFIYRVEASDSQQDIEYDFGKCAVLK